MKESQIQAKIMKYLESIGAYPIKIVSATKAGNPDIICCYSGVFVAIEVKQPGRKPDLLQQAKITRIRKAGGFAFVATSVDECKDWFAALNQAVAGYTGKITKPLTANTDSTE